MPRERQKQVVKNLPANARDVGDAGSTPGSGRSPGGGNGNQLQYFFLGPTDRGAWQATVHGAAESLTQLSTHACSKFLLYSEKLVTQSGFPLYAYN